MMHWIVPWNEEKFLLNDLLKESQLVDWRQLNYYSVGDIIFIYNSRPLHRITHKMVVERIDVPSSEYLNDRKFWKDTMHLEEGFEKKIFMRLRLLKHISETAELCLEDLRKYGLKGTIQSPRRIYEGVDKELLEHICSEVDASCSLIEDNSSDIIDDPNNLITEGAKTTVIVNKYERNPEARQKCIEANGCSCAVCGMNFEKVYGILGSGLIHVHHIIPISEIGEEYVIDPVHDLVPVCPNCHAMLHKGIDRRVLSVEELKTIIKPIDSDER